MQATVVTGGKTWGVMACGIRPVRCNRFDNFNSNRAIGTIFFQDWRTL